MCHDLEHILSVLNVQLEKLTCLLVGETSRLGVVLIKLGSDGAG